MRQHLLPGEAEPPLLQRPSVALSGPVRPLDLLLVWSLAGYSRLWLSGPCFPLAPNGPWLFMYFLLSHSTLRTLLHRPRGPCDES